jgi:hypothetical protein
LYYAVFANGYLILSYLIYQSLLSFLVTVGYFLQAPANNTDNKNGGNRGESNTTHLNTMLQALLQTIPWQ